MQGEIDSFDAHSGVGEIAGIDGRRYRFTIAEAGPVPSAMGVWVNFAAGEDGVARNMTLAQAETSETGLNSGAVVRRAFAAIARHWMLYLGGAVVLTGGPAVLSTWGQLDLTLHGFTPANVLALVLGMLGSAGCFAIFVGSVARPTLQGFRGEKTSLAETLRCGARRAAPLFALGVLATLGIMAGLVLMLIPGVILSISWSVVAPSLAVEDRTIFQSFGRSRALTEGRRGAIFGLLVVSGLLSLALGIAMVRLGASITADLDVRETMIVMIAVDVLSTAVTNVVYAAGITALYYELRTAKEGEGAEALAAVFS